MTVPHSHNGELANDAILARIAGVPDLATLETGLFNKRVLVLGAGDLVAKKEAWVAFMKRLGVQVYLADVVEQPKALATLDKYIHDFVHMNGGSLADLGQFDLLDVSTWGYTHLPMALRFWDRAEVIVTTKPVDTNLELLRAMRSSGLFKPLKDRLLVHDHYGGRWILREAASRMPRWHGSEGFIRQVQIYILERKSVNEEMDRLNALRDGVCLDLVPHAVKVIQTLLPIGATWQHGKLRFVRRDLRLTVKGGAREHNVGCPIGGKVETFAAINLRGEDVVEIDGAEGRPFWFECLIVVGKGLVANDGDDKDTKGVSILFETGNRLNIDLETQRAHAPSGELILPPTDVLHRGINLPLIELTRAGFPKTAPPDVAALFQTFEQAVDAAELIDAARRLNWLGRAYRPRASVVNMINAIPRAWWCEGDWQLEALPRIAIGDVPQETLVVL